MGVHTCGLPEASKGGSPGRGGSSSCWLHLARILPFHQPCALCGAQKFGCRRGLCQICLNPRTQARGKQFLYYCHPAHACTQTTRYTVLSIRKGGKGGDHIVGHYLTPQLQDRMQHMIDMATLTDRRLAHMQAFEKLNRHTHGRLEHEACMP
jgi:hypothetical protein